MSNSEATALAHPNIALIKYWGDRDTFLKIPANGSISMNLEGLTTTTKVRYDTGFKQDHLTLNGIEITGAPLERVQRFMDHIRVLANISLYAEIVSDNNFPTGVGIASSASAFAALSLAASRAAGLTLDEKECSRLARRGSGSACRSIPAGFVEWIAGDRDENSYAFSFAPPEYWDLVDCIAIVTSAHKKTGSNQGHGLAPSSLFQSVRVSDTLRRLEICRQAVLDRNFNILADIIETDSNLMHSVMITSSPPLFYWEPATLQIIKTIPLWRNEGIPVCYTIDAGPNVHVICPSSFSDEVTWRLQQMEGIHQVLKAGVGSAAWINK